MRDSAGVAIVDRRAPLDGEVQRIRVDSLPAVDISGRGDGRNDFGARIREHCRLAREWARYVEADTRFVLAAPVTMAVVCFRFVIAGVDDATSDLANETIVGAVNASGEAYLTHTRVGGRTVMRVGIGNILTTPRHLAAVWECNSAKPRAWQRKGRFPEPYRRERGTCAAYFGQDAPGYASARSMTKVWTNQKQDRVGLRGGRKRNAVTQSTCRPRHPARTSAASECRELLSVRSTPHV